MDTIKDSKLIFVTGGAFQGKRDYVMRNFNISKEQIAVPSEDGSLESGDLNKICICGFHRVIKKMTQEGADVIRECDDLLKRHFGKTFIIIMNDVGNGIVPIDKMERSYRENAGRAGCYIAHRADIVVKVVCGCAIGVKNV